MSIPALQSSATQPVELAPSPEQTLRRLFLMLFLRGSSSRGLKKQTAPKSIGQKMALNLVFYALFGCFALFFLGQPIFALSVYLHAMTFVFLGMFVASSSGELLFNKEEADILLHRPVTPKALLWAKVRVLIEVSLWLGGAFNLAGLCVGLASSNGDWRFPIVHAASTTLEAMFCTGSVVLVYQLCLRWFGRERLEGLMTSAQVLVSVAAVVSGQLLPQLLSRAGKIVAIGQASWWLVMIPPAWFAGFDDALAGSAARGSWLLAAIGIVATLAVLSAAFGRLARDYGAGLQTLGETVSRPPRKSERRRWIDRLVELPLLRWWLRDPVTRASFLLTAAYLARDRDVKLRIYPSIAPFLVLPLVVAIGSLRQEEPGGFGSAFVGAYLGLIPMVTLDMLRYSQQWQASDIFRVAPMASPAPLCRGARRAIHCFLTLPAVIAVAVIVWLPHRNISDLFLLLPGIIALPVFALVPGLVGAVPLSIPAEGAKSASRGLVMIAGIIVAMAISGLAFWARYVGIFWGFIVAEVILAIGVHRIVRLWMERVPWRSLE